MNIGRESDGLCQPMTTCFQVGGIDVGIDDTYMDAYKARKPLTGFIWKLRKKGGLKIPGRMCLFSSQPVQEKYILIPLGLSEKIRFPLELTEAGWKQKADYRVIGC